MIRRGFTLLEIMVSLMIFSVVSLALIGVLNAAVKLFRAGESARAANDETIATLAQLDDDLKRMVPAVDNGFLFTKTKSNNGHAAGNMVLAFKIRNPEGGTISETGIGARLIVVWWVDDQGYLNRKSDFAADSGNSQTTELLVTTSIYGSTQHVANGCLYFGVDLSTDTTPRTDLAWNPNIPAAGTTFCTEPQNPGAIPDPFPTAIRITAVLTGGSRNVITGRAVRAENGSDIRITGVGQVPVTTGAMARVGDSQSSDVEWVTYTSFAHGVLACSAGRAQRRTTQIGAVAGLDVTFAPSYSLVRTLPR